MYNTGDKIRSGLQKRLEAMSRFNARKEEYEKTRERIILDIEEARIIWKKTMEQLPQREF